MTSRSEEASVLASHEMTIALLCWCRRRASFRMIIGSASRSAQTLSCRWVCVRIWSVFKMFRHWRSNGQVEKKGFFSFSLKQKGWQLLICFHQRWFAHKNEPTKQKIYHVLSSGRWSTTFGTPCKFVSRLELRESDQVSLGKPAVAGNNWHHCGGVDATKWCWYTSDHT